MSWKQLLELLKKLPADDLNRTVCITDSGGSETYAIELKKDKFGCYYLSGA